MIESVESVMTAYRERARISRFCLPPRHASFVSRVDAQDERLRAFAPVKATFRRAPSSDDAAAIGSKRAASARARILFNVQKRAEDVRRECARSTCHSSRAARRAPL